MTLFMHKSKALWAKPSTYEEEEKNVNGSGTAKAQNIHNGYVFSLQQTDLHSL
jgi:hypothetical protein